MYCTFLYTVLNIKIRDGKGRCTNYRCTILLNLGKIVADYVIRFMRNQQFLFFCLFAFFCFFEEVPNILKILRNDNFYEKKQANIDNMYSVVMAGEVFSD